LTDTASSLAWATEGPPPPERLRASILSQAAAERGNVVPLPVRRSPLFRATAAVAAIAAVAAVAVGVWAATRPTGSCASGWRCTALPGGQGLVTVDPAGRGVLIAQKLPAAPAGKTYEAWVIRNGTAKPAGTFARGGVVQLRARVPRGATVAATIERAGGAPAPTTRPLFAVRV
jgi:anti-sigma-K factor RskA